MSYQDHLKTCSYCQKAGRINSSEQTHNKPTIFIKSASSYRKALKPTISVKSASSYGKRKKLSELAAIIIGISYPSLESIPMFQTKGASEVARKPGTIEREVKLRELGKMIKSFVG